MKTIKVIDLLNMIANREYNKLPKKVKYHDDVYKLFEDNRDGIKYVCTDDATKYVCGDNHDYENNLDRLYKLMTAYLFYRIEKLDDEVEILENAPKMKKEILNKAEKEYLKALIKPFRNKVFGILKRESAVKSFIVISIENDATIYLPNFTSGTMYLNMEANKNYTLEELGL